MVVFYYYPYHWVLFCASLMCIVAAFQLRKYLSISGYRHLFAALICIFLWTVLRSAEIASVGLTVKAWFADLEWAALLGAMTAFFQVVIRHTGRVRWYRSRALSVVLFSVPAVFVLCLLFPQTHSFLRPSIYLDASRSLPVIGPSYSPLAWIFFIYSLALMVLSITLLLRAAVEERNIGFGQSVLLLLCLVLPIAVAIIDAVGALQMDLLPVAFMGSALLLLFSLSKYHMFHAVPAAYSKIVANMEPGIFIFNAAERLVDLNASAERMLHIQKSDVIGQHPDVVFSSQEELLSFFKVKSQSLAEFFLHGSKVCYEFAVTRLTDKRERLLGWLLTAYDVTERKRREERNRFMAMHDSLTGLPNRRALLETARQLLQYAVERDERLGIVYVDA
ncbi:MAG: histidine kinase N-terminal 7TM domain-containing protein, partial [Spirochaetota bacterium]